MASDRKEMYCFLNSVNEMDNVKVKEEAGLENYQSEVDIRECDVVIKEEIGAESWLEATLKEIKSEGDSSATDFGALNDNHCFLPEFIICKNDPDSNNGETNYKAPLWLKTFHTDASAASDLSLSIKKGTHNWKDEVSPVGSARECKEAFKDETGILPFSSDANLEQKNCVMIQGNIGCEEPTVHQSNVLRLKYLKEGVFTLNSKPNNSKRSTEHRTLASGMGGCIREVHRCTICEKTFTYRSELRKHNMIHEGKKPHKCSICEKSFTWLYKLKNHYLTHEGRKPYKCEICGKHFSVKYNLKEHYLIHLGKRPHKCEICGKSFTKKQSLKEHNYIHEGKKPYRCEICNTSFAQMSSLRTHNFIHEGKRPHKCEICNKSFTRLAHLKTHRSTHEGTKQYNSEGKRVYTCEICEKNFSNSFKFREHQLIHDGIKPYKCNTCNKSFTQRSNLQRHNLIHEGKKPHKCEICEKSFARLTHLRAHNLMHDRSNRYKCKLCDKSYTQMTKLKAHEAIHEEKVKVE